MRSVQGRRINGVSPPPPSRESILMDLHLFLLFLCDVFHKTHLFQVFLSFKMIWFSHETIHVIELLIIVKIENWPIKRCPEQGGNHESYLSHFWSGCVRKSRLCSTLKVIAKQLWTNLAFPPRATPQSSDKLSADTRMSL